MGDEMKTHGIVRKILSPSQYKYLAMASRGCEISDICDVTDKAPSTVRSSLSQSYSRIKRAGLGLDETLSSMRVESGVLTGARCKECNLLLPCRRDGMPGTCDSRIGSVEELQGISDLFDAIREIDNVITHDPVAAHHNRYVESKNRRQTCPGEV